VQVRRDLERALDGELADLHDDDCKPPAVSAAALSRRRGASFTVILVVLPIHDRNPTRRAPVVTYALIAVNVVAFLLSPVPQASLGSATATQSCRDTAFFFRWGAQPTELAHNHALAFAIGSPVGAASCAEVPAPYDKIPVLSALTSMFVHGGWLHLLGNMLFLWIFGNNVEDRLGRLRYLLFYLGIGMAAAYCFAVTRPNSIEPLVGASGAIAGVLGAYLVWYPRAKITSLFVILPIRLPAWVVLGGWFGLQAVYAHGVQAQGGGVAYLVHVFGFGFGAAIALLLRGSTGRRQRGNPPRAPAW